MQIGADPRPGFGKEKSQMLYLHPVYTDFSLGERIFGRSHKHGDLDREWNSPHNPEETARKR